MPRGRHMAHDSKHHHMHSKHEIKEKFKTHRHKVPGYVARELARTDVPKEIAKAAREGNVAKNAPSPRL
ncbi:MAG TPA: hypothetical protein VNK03_06160 [Gammaproteobacteria bacterium]|nr:hypothetical protein [Gammaproteobacteria bacterium]